MDFNIYKNSRISSIFIIYKDGIRVVKLPVTVKFLDKNECYLAAELPNNFAKPQKNTTVNIIAYTEVGVYNASVKIIETTLSSLKEITFVTTAPKSWNYQQLRISSRKDVKIPFSIKYNDGYEITGITNDVSLGGISFISALDMPELYTRFNAKLTLDLSNYPDTDNISVDVKFLRINDEAELNENEKFYIFRILELSQVDTLVLKRILINTD